MSRDFSDILKSLNDHEVKYVLVGGMAANLHGSPISTIDCDIVVDLDPENLIKLAQAVTSFSPTFRHKIPPQKFDEKRATEGGWKNIYLDTEVGVLDCLGDIKGLGDFTECEARSIDADFGDFSLRVLSREALIKAKKAMGRPKDLMTVAHLEIGGELEG